MYWIPDEDDNNSNVENDFKDQESDSNSTQDVQCGNISRRLCSFLKSKKQNVTNVNMDEITCCKNPLKCVTNDNYVLKDEIVQETQPNNIVETEKDANASKNEETKNILAKKAEAQERKLAKLAKVEELIKIEEENKAKELERIEIEIEEYKYEILRLKSSKYAWHLNTKSVTIIAELGKWIKGLKKVKEELIKSPIKANYITEDNDSMHNLLIEDDEENWMPPMIWNKWGHFKTPNFDGGYITITKIQEIDKAKLVQTRTVEFANYWVPSTADEDGSIEATEAMHRDQARKMDLKKSRQKALGLLRKEREKDLKRIENEISEYTEDISNLKKSKFWRFQKNKRDLINEQKQWIRGLKIQKKKIQEVLDTKYPLENHKKSSENQNDCISECFSGILMCCLTCNPH